ncbi:hypothetical protein [Renibacterium salmoninarum]|nr:hypothetical protein [Renibacterium salmoninarum]
MNSIILSTRNLQKSYGSQNNTIALAGIEVNRPGVSGDFLV